MFLMARTNGKVNGMAVEPKTKNPGGKGISRPGRGGDTGVYARHKKLGKPSGDGRANNGAKKGSDNGSGRPKGSSPIRSNEQFTILKEKIDKLGIEMGHDADPMMMLIKFCWDEGNEWNQRREAAETVIVRLYPKLGTIEGQPDTNLQQNNQTNIDMSGLSLEDKRKLLSMSNKVNGKDNGTTKGREGVVDDKDIIDV